MTVRGLLMLALLGPVPPVVAAPGLTSPAAEDDSWSAARAALKKRLAVAERPRRAKNVILFVGDGMGISTITAARIFDAQDRSRASGFAVSGEDNSLSFEALPNVALVKTYNSNAQVPDSAGTASALNTGIKTRIGYLNFRVDQNREACAKPAELPRTVAEIAKSLGLGVGVVTTTRITHATPAAVYAHAPSRNWEGADPAFPEADRKFGCRDIASQMVSFGGELHSGLDVMLGGGRARFKPLAAGGLRDDGIDLTEVWRKRVGAGRYIESAAEFRALKPGGPPVLGLLADDHLAFETDRDAADEPSLSEMTQFAVRQLSATAPNGFYLMVEGGRIDHAHHLTNPYRALKDTQAFSEAIAAALKLVDLNETLVLVTADHSHVLTIAGYPERGNDILGYIRPVTGGESRTGLSPEGWALSDRGEPMTTLGYANGPFSVPAGKLSRLLPPTDKDRLADKTHGLDSETHGGEDVALFAGGAGSQPVGGVIEQNVIFHIIAEAFGWR